MTAPLVAITILALFISQAIPSRRANVGVFVSIAEHYGTIYVPGPSNGAHHVLLKGEPLKIRLSIRNDGEEQQVRVARSYSAPFRVHVLSEGSGKPVASGVVSQTAQRRGAGALKPTELPASLKSRERLEWEVAVPDFQNLLPGRYRVQADAQVEDSAGRPLINNDHLLIELRDVGSEAERVELMRIAATRAFRNGDFAETETAARRLLKAYGQSALAYMLIGDVARIRHDANSARAAYMMSAQLLRGRGDTLLAAVASEHMISELLGTIEMRLSGL